MKATDKTPYSSFSTSYSASQFPPLCLKKLWNYLENKELLRVKGDQSLTTRNKYPAPYISRKADWHPSSFRFSYLHKHIPLPQQQGFLLSCGRPVLFFFWPLQSSVMETTEFLSVQNQQVTPPSPQTSYFCQHLPHLWKFKALWLPQLPHGQEAPE